jgi:hypothetical protein
MYFMHIRLFLFFIIIVAGIAACAEISHYAINVNYIPQKGITRKSSAQGKFAITIAAFNDARTVDDKTIIGKKVKSKNDKILALATAENFAHEVTSAFRYFLLKAGYSVDEVMPEWDLRDSSISSAWETLVIGGSIDELEVICRSEGAGVQYNTRVKLHVAFADVQRRKILHTTTLESSASLKHLMCSGEMMQEQINGTLSMAIEKIAENGELDKIIAEISKVRSENLTD